MRIERYNTSKRAKNRKPLIDVLLVATDDYGDMIIAASRYSGKHFRANTGVVHGATIPQVNLAFLDDPLEEDRHKASVTAFHECEANCNTCRNLIRIPSDKRLSKLSGVHYGRCSTIPDNSHPYPPDANGVMRFSPLDFQGMPCWEPRV